MEYKFDVACSQILTVRCGAKAAKSVENYIKKAERSSAAGSVFPLDYKKRLTDDSTIFVWTRIKWDPCHHKFDKGLHAALRRNDKYNDVAHAYKLVYVGERDVTDICFNNKGLLCFADLAPGIIYPKEWYEDRSEKKYDIVLLEKTDADVLSKSDTEKLFAHLKCDEGYPLEIHDLMDHLVFGYITRDAADKLKWEFNSLEKFVCRMLTMRDVQLGLTDKTEDLVYKHKGLRIWLDW